MKLSISTETLKEMVSKAAKGVGNNKLMPISSLMSIKMQEGNVVIITTDGYNYLYVKHENKGDDFNVTIEADKFIKLIGKQTCEKITMSVSENALEIKGDGNYKIDIPVDPATGEFIQYPDPMSEIVLDESTCNEVELATIKDVISTCKPSVAVTMEEIAYTGYFAGEKVMTTNNFVAASTNAKLFSENVLIPSEYMDLLSVITSEKVSSYIVGDNIICTSPDCDVFGTAMEELDEFPNEALDELFNKNVSCFCEISKGSLLATLDRIALFVGAYDEDVVNFTFTKDGLQVSSVQSNGIEIVPYLDNKDFVPFDCAVNVRVLIDELKAYPSDTVLMYYGDDTIIKLVDGDTVFSIALIEKESIEEGE